LQALGLSQACVPRHARVSTPQCPNGHSLDTRVRMCVCRGDKALAQYLFELKEVLDVIRACERGRLSPPLACGQPALLPAHLQNFII
jgi:hypothetical protein